MNQRLLFFSLVIVTSLTSTFSVAQDLPKCRTYDALDMLLMKYPHLREQIQHDEQLLEDHTENYIAERAGGDDETYIVPVVFHIVHDNGPENISDEQVHDAMAIINRDFAMTNEDIEDVVPSFTNVLSGDIKIEFKLARKDPEGNCTNGILRVESDETYEGGQDMKDLSRWPRDMYLNVWICAEAGGAAGYSYLPSSVNSGGFGVANDGIVMLHNYTGSIGTSNVQRSRTFTHEAGHWLNLSHLWGPTNSPNELSNCDFDDGISDTPETVGWTACNLSGESCGSLDNVQNYMEYSYCSRMFTAGQKDRMRAALTSIVADRNELWQEENIEATGVLLESALCAAVFTSDYTTVCAGSTITFEDQSFNDPTDWTWDFGDGQTISGVSNPSHVYSESGTYSVSLTVSNGIDEVSSTSVNYITVLSSGVISNPLEEGFEYLVSELDEEDYWEIIETQGTLGWELYDNTAFTGEQCVRIRNNNNSELYDEDELVSSSMDFSAASDIQISYKWAFVTKEEATDDRLRVYVSKDCGLTWDQKKLHRGFTDLPTADPSDFQFIPDDQTEWAENTIIIDEEEYFVPGFRVKFRFQNFGGNNIYLDDINVGTSASLSIEEPGRTSSAIIYPNPSNDFSILEFTDGQSLSDLNIAIYNSMGQMIRTLNDIDSNSIRLNRDALASGIYLISVEYNGKLEQLTWVLE